MRILYHHRTLADGAEGVHIAEMVKAFRTLGHEVRVLGLAANDAEPGRRGWIAAVRRLCPRVVFEAAAVASNLIEYIQTRRVIQAFRPDLLYKRHARHDIGALVAARRAGVPSVLEVNCLFTGSGYRQFEPMVLEGVARSLERRALRMATLAIVVSSPLAAQVAELSGVRALLTPNGADPERFDPANVAAGTIRARYRLGRGLVIGWTGVLREWHGLELLLDAVARLPEAHLLIVGDGPARDALAHRATALGMADRLTVTGRVGHAEVPEHVRDMDIAVVASDRTGVASPMKLLEYMAMGRAVVAPSLPNVTDVVTHGENGWLFPPDDAAGLHEALRTLAADAELRQRLGSAARRTIVEARNWVSIAELVVHRVARGGTGSRQSAAPGAPARPGDGTLLTGSRSDDNSGQPPHA